MFHFVTLFTVNAEAEEAFVRGLRMGGAWLNQARRVAPALVAADLLRHQRRPMFLCHDIWVTPEAYARACGSQAVRQLLDARKQMAADSFEIGAFTFPALKVTAATSDASLTHAESLSPAGWLSTEQFEDELFDAAVQATMNNPNATAVALAQIDAYFALEDDHREKQHRQSLLELLQLLRPNLAELLGAPSSRPQRGLPITNKLLAAGETRAVARQPGAMTARFGGIASRRPTRPTSQKRGQPGNSTGPTR